MKQVIDKLEQTPEYTQWRSENKDAFLVHVFVMHEEGAEDKFDIGFYDKEKGMTTFTLGTAVEMKQDKEVFQKPGSEILALDMDKVKVDMDKALEIAADVQKEKYKGHEPLKQIVILQRITEAQVWNITYVTKTFKTLNIKVDAGSGEVVNDTIIELFQFDK